jgi:hypothetical protein
MDAYSGSYTVKPNGEDGAYQHANATRASYLNSRS